MASDLYEHDIATWSEQQAELLRRLARGERVNGVHWENVAEEIESVGRSEVKSVASLLRMALVLGLKLAHWPGHPAADAWRAEIGNFRARHGTITSRPWRGGSTRRCCCPGRCGMWPGCG